MRSIETRLQALENRVIPVENIPEQIVDIRELAESLHAEFQAIYDKGLVDPETGDYLILPDPRGDYHENSLAALASCFASGKIQNLTST